VRAARIPSGHCQLAEHSERHQQEGHQQRH
jgi:hypothetical protein